MGFSSEKEKALQESRAMIQKLELELYNERISHRDTERRVWEQANKRKRLKDENRKLRLVMEEILREKNFALQPKEDSVRLQDEIEIKESPEHGVNMSIMDKNNEKFGNEMERMRSEKNKVLQEKEEVFAALRLLEDEGKSILNSFSMKEAEELKICKRLRFEKEKALLEKEKAEKNRNEFIKEIKC